MNMAERLRSNKKIWLAIAALEILLICLAGFLYSRREPVELSFTQDDLFYESGERGAYLDRSVSSAYIATEVFTLPKGLYTLRVSYQYSGPVKIFAAYTDERYNYNASGDITATVRNGSICDFAVTSSERPMQIRGRLQQDADDSAYLLITGIEITDSPLALRNFVFRLFLLLLLIDLAALTVLFWKRLRLLPALAGEGGRIGRTLAVLIFVSSIPLMTGYLLDGHDLPFHLMRIEGVKAGLQAGAFPVRIQPNWLNGHGYAASIFYGDLLLYIPAVLRMFGVSIQASYNFYVLLINTATVFLAYFCFSRMSAPKAGLVAAALYTLNIYRLTCIYTRSAVGEYSAMVFLPLVLYGLWKVYMLPEDSREHKNSWITIAAGYTGLIVTHMISCEMAALFTALACLLLWKKTFRLRNFRVLFTSVAVMVLLNLWFLVPFADYMANGVYNLNSPDAYTEYRLDERTTFPAQLFMTEYAETEGAYSFSRGTVEEMPQTIGAAFLLLGIVWFVVRLGKKEENERDRREEGICLTFGLLSLLFTTFLLPYTPLARIFPFLEFPERSIQYPWRFLSMAGVFFCWFAAIFFKKSWLDGAKKQWMAGALLLVAFWQGLSYMSGVLNETSPFFIYQEGNLTSMEVSNAEYLPYGSDVNDYVPMPTYDPGVLQVSAWNSAEDGVHVTLANLTGQEQKIEVPLVYYKGYHAWADGEELATEPGTSSRITVRIPSGFEGEILVGFREPWYWRICEAVSLLMLLGIVVRLGKEYGWAERIGRRKGRQG